MRERGASLIFFCYLVIFILILKKLFKSILYFVNNIKKLSLVKFMGICFQ